MNKMWKLGFCNNNNNNNNNNNSPDMTWHDVFETENINDKRRSKDWQQTGRANAPPQPLTQTGFAPFGKRPC
jgi:hypothetical protein